MFTLLVIIFFCISTNAQNQVYWREGFSTFTVTADPTNAAPTTQTGEAGDWKTYGTWRTTGTGCPYSDATPNPHVRSSSTATFPTTAGLDTAYIISPLVNFGIKEFHMIRSRATRQFTIYTTTDVDINTTNWTLVSVWPKSAAAPVVLCTDSMALINSATAKRIQIRFERAGNSDIDSVYLTSVNIITPVKYAGINATLANGLVKLSWNVATEVNTSKYVIEKSADGVRFSTAGEVAANNSIKYGWIDNTPYSGVNYYRVKGVDKDGVLSYSSIVSLSTKTKTAEMVIAPNPIKGGVMNVQLNNFEKATFNLHVISSTGQKVYSTKINNEGGFATQNIILPSNIVPGMYKVQLVNGSTQTVKTIIVQ